MTKEEFESMPEIQKLNFALNSAMRHAENINANRDMAYEERNRLIALLSKLWPSHLCSHDKEDKNWDKEWLTIVCIHSPVGQLCWHIHDSHRHLFGHLSLDLNHWDNHTTQEKYERIASYGTNKGNLIIMH